MFDSLRVPVIVAPMAGGPSTPELVAAAATAGAFGFLAGGYLSAAALTDQIRRTRELAGEGFGVNLFVPGARSTVDVRPYASSLQREAERYEVRAGAPQWDDDVYSAKLDLLVAQRVPVVSFTFGTPAENDIDRLHHAGSKVVVTVTTPEEASQAAEAGADALCVQGFEAGGHRAVFVDDPGQAAGGELFGLLAAMRLVSAVTDLPLVAAGGLVHGADVAAVVVAGARAAQLGTAFLRADEAGTNGTQRRALASAGRQTAFTRAFSGRPARGMVNRFMREHSEQAPAAYPQLHNLSRPIRAAAGKAGDPEAMSLWAGQTYGLAGEGPAADIIETLRTQARDAMRGATTRFA
ncbi:2-nitropropane dioxygenase [Prauserella marina]|uniref:Propionate 3-nitronate monooxygenase n=1 Tax=Prauserella marina TaxID=530584 RepID=A0A222VMD8_9PSEU|nr:nitronate monooxygenase [Prauserella marina]ASR35088.1 2-nitropropane dioxygenase [Prauserella marina]PWV85160.1 nitroalkane oxidase [Prauserella marina]SDC03423.1 nitronate monooxygenase [Prauserella marina]